MDSFLARHSMHSLISLHRKSQNGADDVEKESFLDKENPPSQADRTQSSHRVCILTVVNTSILCASLWLNFGWQPWRVEPKIAITQATSYYSPIIEDVAITYHDVHLNGTFWPPPNPPFSRMEPGPEADAAWQWVDQKAPDVFPISQEVVLKLGKDPATVARFPDSVFHLGDAAYVAGLDSLHKLHCLNEVRKVAFEGYSSDKEKKKKKKGKKEHGELFWVHLRHCVDMLAQDLMCHADADVMTYQWVDAQKKPFPDFAIGRRCRDFGQIVDWRERNMVDMDEYWKIEKPEGTKPVPAEAGYYDMFGFRDSELYPGGKGYDV